LVSAYRNEPTAADVIRRYPVRPTFMIADDPQSIQLTIVRDHQLAVRKALTERLLGAYALTGARLKSCYPTVTFGLRRPTPVVAEAADGAHAVAALSKRETGLAGPAAGGGYSAQAAGRPGVAMAGDHPR